jgi:hypothetical protein
MTGFVIASAVAAAATAASSIYSAVSAAKAADAERAAAKEARNLSNLNAANIQSETDEMARRQRLANQRLESTARARAAATGVRPGEGSLFTFIKDMQNENKAELDWLIRSGYNKAQLERNRGEYEYDIGMNRADAYSRQVWGNVISGIGGLAKLGMGAAGAMK